MSEPLLCFRMMGKVLTVGSAAYDRIEDAQVL